VMNHIAERRRLDKKNIGHGASAVGHIPSIKHDCYNHRRLPPGLSAFSPSPGMTSRNSEGPVHDPEKHVPDPDRGWEPVFVKDHAQVKC
jgi:hypothetical protein